MPTEKKEQQTTPEPITKYGCNVFITGDSGSGMSFSMMNLPEDKTVIFNTGIKLPFKKKFHKEIKVDDYKDLIGIRDNEDSTRNKQGLLEKAIESDKYDFIVIDDFTSWIDKLQEYSYESHKDTYEAYTYYNDEIRVLIKILTEQTKKIIFVIGISEYIEGENGVLARRISVFGKKWAGKIEREFNVVFFTRPRQDGDKINYYFETQTDSMHTAKSPYEMFESRLIPNDLLIVSEHINKYYTE